MEANQLNYALAGEMLLDQNLSDARSRNWKTPRKCAYFGRGGSYYVVVSLLASAESMHLLLHYPSLSFFSQWIVFANLLGSQWNYSSCAVLGLHVATLCDL
eukprot:941654-Amphidinium_carterae.1